MQSKVLAEMHTSIIKVEDGTLRANRVNDEFVCPLCTSDRCASYLREETANEHIEQTHLKSKVPYEGYVIAKCGLQCDPDKKKFHYHCVECGKIIFSRGDFFYHLKGHEAQKGLKSRRGRKKGYASLAQALGQTELFSSVAVVLSPQMMGLLPDDKEEFLVGLQTKTGINCTVNEENIYVLTGTWSSIVQARAMLEELAVRKLELEKEKEAAANAAAAAAAPIDFATLASVAPLSMASTTMAATAVERPPSTGSDGNDDIVSETDDEPEEDDGEFEPEDVSALSASGGGRHYSSRRRSSRKRKLNRNYDDYVLPSKIAKEDEDGALKTPDGLANSQTGDGDYVVNVIISNMMTNGGAASEGDHQTGEEGGMMEPDPSELPYGSDVEVELDEGIFICQFCGDTFAGRIQFDEHREGRLCRSSAAGPDGGQTGAGQESAELRTEYHCQDCDAKVVKAFDMKMHRMRMHDAPRYECSICHKKFGPLYDLRIHMKYTGHGTGERAMRQTEQCHICNKVIQAKNLKQHVLQVHEKQKPFQCEICSKAFGTRYLVREHMESHKDKEERPRPFRCETCGQGFYKKLPLDEHRTKHEGNPHYRCELCGKQFFHSSGHKRHMQHHSSERNFHCQACGKSFKTSTNLSAHKAVHKPQTYACGCGKTYQQRHTLKTHQDKCPTHLACAANQVPEEQLQQQPPQRYMCGYCHETFIDFVAVQEHLVTHVEDGTSTITAADGSTMQVEATELDASTLQQLAAAAEVDGTCGMIVDGASGTGHIIGASSLVQLALTATSSSSLEHLAVAASGIDASELDASAAVHVMSSGVTVGENEISKHALEEAIAEAAAHGGGNLVDMMVLPAS